MIDRTRRAWSSWAIGAPKIAMIPSPVNLSTVPSKDLEETVHDPIPIFRIDLLAEVYRALQISGEHRHLLALAFDGAT